MANARLNPPAHASEQIKALAATGFSKVGCASHFQVNVERFNQWLNESPGLQRAFDEGREQERHALHSSLYRQAIEKNNAVAAMFLLKARHGYKEGESTQQHNRVNITFNLPGALSPEDYKLAKVAGVKVIDAK